VSAAQFDAVMALVGPRADLTVVGDPNQSIYGWNGADPSLLATLPQRFPGLDVVRLDANYRSAPPIVHAAARVLGIEPAAAGGERGTAVPTVTAHATAGEEADAVARAVRMAHAPHTAWSDIAVLARSNAYLEGIAAALHRARIPYGIAGRLALLGRPAVRDGLAALPRGVPAVDAAAQLRSSAHDYDDAVERGALHEVADLARDFDALVPGGSVGAFLEWLPTARPGDTMAGGDAVQLATFHKAKGLEWPTVFVVGVQDGMVPVAGGDVDEERRLLYVAMTRAERVLHLSYAGLRSPFLPEGFEPLEVPAPSPQRIADLRAALNAASDPAA
jgi:DNA helicase II / ATP-dependent DNA helicase PcrA